MLLWLTLNTSIIVVLWLQVVLINALCVSIWKLITVEGIFGLAPH